MPGDGASLLYSIRRRTRCHVGGHDPLVCPGDGPQAACPQRNVPFSTASLRLCTVTAAMSSCPAILSGSAHSSRILSRLVSPRLHVLASHIG